LAWRRRRPPTPDPSTAIQAPVGIVVGPDGALWFTNSANGTFRRLDTDGTLDRFRDAT
jgi:streptogramin lyase